ncbi:hypothetical protein lerEdw1_017649 [Lerista edwardsae]|nr:hypothetical protein lerEdw1_017649 [Lerista edwardsae]
MSSSGHGSDSTEDCSDEHGKFSVPDSHAGAFASSQQHTLKVITAAKPPFRHQTNTFYTPMTALKHADPTGVLMADAFYKLVFRYDTLLQVSLKAIRLIRWQAHKMRQGARLLGFR